MKSQNSRNQHGFLTIFARYRGSGSWRPKTHGSGSATLLKTEEKFLLKVRIRVFSELERRLQYCLRNPRIVCNAAHVLDLKN
jgi:hypothetical protein